MPRTPSGKRRPYETLLQLVVVNLIEMHRISRSVDANFLELAEQNCNTTHLNWVCLLFMKTAAGGQFDWGGALSKRYR